MFQGYALYQLKVEKKEKHKNILLYTPVSLTELQREPSIYTVPSTLCLVDPGRLQGGGAQLNQRRATPAGSHDPGWDSS